MFGDGRENDADEENLYIGHPDVHDQYQCSETYQGL